MSTATLTRSEARTEGRYRFRHVATMEWLRLRSIRSTAWIMGVFAAGMIGIAIVVLAHYNWASMPAAQRAGFDPTNQGFAGLAIGQLALGVLGVLAITSGHPAYRGRDLPALGFGLLCGYAVAALAVGGVVVARRDA